jgi:hypothetical protein
MTRTPTDDPVEYLVIRLPRSQMARVRKWLHQQYWYTGEDVPLHPVRDRMGIRTETAYQAIQAYWLAWQQFIREHRQ